jgi:hypothetical protein
MAFVDVAIAVGTAVGWEGIGAGAAAALGGGILGAGAGGLYGGLTGGDIGKDMLMGGALGAGGAFLGAPAAAEVAPEIAGGGSTIAGGGSTVAGGGNTLAGGSLSSGAPASGFGSGIAPSSFAAPSAANAYSLGATTSGIAPGSLGSMYAGETLGTGATTGTLGALTPAAAAPAWSSYLPSGKQAALGLTAAALAKGLGQQNTITPQQSQGVPAGLDFKFDRNTYQPATAPYYGGINPQYGGPPAQRIQGYADGGEIGTVEEMSRQNSLGNNQMFPQSGLGGLTGANTYQNATNTPTPNNVLEPTDAVTDPYTGQMSFATGGKTPRTPTASTQQNTSLNLPEIKKYMAAARTIEGHKAVSTAAQGGDYNAQFALNQAQGNPLQDMGAQSQMPVQAAQGGIMGGTIGSYSDGGQMLKGPGDGMSDSIPAKIGKHQPARLADSEFVVPADVVSHLGNGSSDAGAKQLYAMMDRIRKARTGTKKQGKQIKPEKYMPA